MLAMRRESDQYYGHSSASDPNSGNSNRIGGTTNYSSGYQQEGILCSLESFNYFAYILIMFSRDTNFGLLKIKKCVVLM